MKKINKYVFHKFVTPHLRNQIIDRLNIVLKTYYNKINAKVGDKYGFEYFELLTIAEILNRELHELINPEAFEYYVNNPNKKL